MLKSFKKSFKKCNISTRGTYNIVSKQIKKNKGVGFMLKSLVNYIKENGGATYNLNSNNYMESGFMCAKAENEYIIDGQVTVEHLQNYITKYAKDLQKENANLGAWYNTENGKTYLDTSFRFENLQDAVEFGRKNNQLAIFNLNTFEEYRL